MNLSEEQRDIDVHATAKSLRSNMQGHSFLQHFPCFVLPGTLGKQVKVPVEDAVTALVPESSTQLQLRASRTALAHVRDRGEPGDRYEVKLSICGRYRAVSWSKI
eukprot:g31478.t1